MKRTFFIITLLLMGIHQADAQCVVYICPNTSACGYAWNDDPNNLLSLFELKEAADKKCQESGGTACQIYKSYDNPGWYGLIKYKTSDGGLHIGVTMEWSTQSDAENDLTALIKENDGAETLFRRTFRVYSKAQHN